MLRGTEGLRDPHVDAIDVKFLVEMHHTPSNNCRKRHRVVLGIDAMYGLAAYN